MRGGPSDEHEVSLKTGANILAHLVREPGGGRAYRPVDVFIDRRGVWHVRGVPASPERALAGVDVVWNALHGAYGEDGVVQRLLERFGVPYTGSRPYASACAMNKIAAKEALGREGVLMARSVTLSVSPDLERLITTVFRTFSQPSVVKPSSSGSSIGVTLARSFAEFAGGVKKAFAHSKQVIVEEFVKGKEATVGVIDHLRGQEHYRLPAVEIVPPLSSPFFDYEAKYGGDSVEHVPGNFSPAEAEELARLAAVAHRSLGLRHYSRSDFIVSPKGVYYLETNTLPGLTNESLLPKSLAAVGLDLPHFVDHVIDLAFRARS